MNQIASDYHPEVTLSLVIPTFNEESNIDAVISSVNFADEIIIVTANSNRHAVSVSQKLVEHLKQNNINVIGVEGELDSGWILVDCGDIVVNIMKQDQRDFYDLEGLWGENSLLKKLN